MLYHALLCRIFMCCAKPRNVLGLGKPKSLAFHTTYLAVTLWVTYLLISQDLSLAGDTAFAFVQSTVTGGCLIEF
jgi:hypothetical protein